MTYEKFKLVQNLGYFMLEGNTYDECAEEFSMKRDTVQRLINEKLKLINPKVFYLIKNRPYMVLQRAIYKKCTIEEARKIFKVSKKDVDKFLMKIYDLSPRSYVAMKNKLYQATYQPK